MSKEYVEQLIKTHIENTECTKCFHFPVCSRHMGGMDLDRCEDFISSADVAPIETANWKQQHNGTHYCTGCGTNALFDNNGNEFCSFHCPTCGRLMPKVVDMNE